MCFKALALGAKGVGIGRPFLWGLGAFGQAGVDRVLEILQGELKLVWMRARSASPTSPARTWLFGSERLNRNRSMSLAGPGTQLASAAAAPRTSATARQMRTPP